MHGSWVVLPYGSHLTGNVGVPALDAPEGNIRTPVRFGAQRDLWNSSFPWILEGTVLLKTLGT